MITRLEQPCIYLRHPYIYLRRPFKYLRHPFKYLRRPFKYLRHPSRYLRHPSRYLRQFPDFCDGHNFSQKMTKNLFSSLFFCICFKNLLNSSILLRIKMIWGVFSRDFRNVAGCRKMSQIFSAFLRRLKFSTFFITDQGF